MENKMKPTLVKQKKIAPQQDTTTKQPAEKKKIVIVRKKPTVVVKKQEKTNNSEDENLQKNTEESFEKKHADNSSKQKHYEKNTNNYENRSHNKKNDYKEKNVNANVQNRVIRPLGSVKKVRKVINDNKPSVMQSTVNSGPVIISGKNLPPLNPIKKERVTTKNTRPVGTVGGVNYDKVNKPRTNFRDRKPDYKNPNGPARNNWNNRPNNQRNNNNAGRVFNKDGNTGNRNFGYNNNRPKFNEQSETPTANPYGKTKRNFSKDSRKTKDWKNKNTKEIELNNKIQIRKKTHSQTNPIPKSIDILESISVSELAKKMNLKAAEIIGKLFSMGMMVTINEVIDAETATIIAEEYGCAVHIVNLYDETVIAKKEVNEDDLRPRAPIVTVMGHVDHGKTKLLDAIRSTNVAGGEFGGITQHIGAYKVNLKDRGNIIFLDTPGHAAFTLMRARGAQITDIVVLVVAANDGVMPQTLEAIDHAKAAKVPIIVAINKIDLPDAKPERVMQQLSDKGLMPEEWGGQTLFCKISALKKEGIDELLENILLQAEMLNLEADPKVPAEGKIIEARIDQGRGIVASVLIQSGTLHQGDAFVSGIYSGHVRAIYDDRGNRIAEAGPSTPVEITGLSDVPSAGDPFQVTENEKYARQISQKRQELEKLSKNNAVKKVTLDNLYDKIQEGDMQELNVIIKGDVQGSVEALQTALEKLSGREIRLRVIRAAAGAIIEDDINLASACENAAIVIGFNVRPTPKAALRADQEKIEIRKYNVIYDAVDDIRDAMEGMLTPDKKEVDVGLCEVRQVFRVPKIGLIAGCYVKEGKVKRKNKCRVIRDNIQINKDLVIINSLKRFKDDAKEVLEGFECGIGIENFQNLQV